jgi:uncharacterized repeat protein (TIGR01451 family)
LGIGEKLGTERPPAFVIAIALVGTLAFVALLTPRTGSATVPTPDFLLRVEASQEGLVVTYSIHFDNVGTASAPSVIVRDTLPDGSVYLGDTGEVVSGVWTSEFTDVAPGTHAIDVSVELPSSVRDGERVVNYVEIEYATVSQTVTKAYWHEMGLQFASPTAPLSPAVALVPILGIVAVAGGLVASRPRRRPQIEQVFLMHNSGMLIHHWAANTSPSRDIDILSGMFVILKEFVRDSFREKVGGLTELQFGDSRVFLAEGRHAILAAVVSGKHVNGLPGRIAATVEEFETAYASVLNGWTGQLDLVPDARAYVDRLVRSARGRGRAAA